MSPVTPSELLIALHNIDCRNDEATLKAVVRGMHASGLLWLHCQHRAVHTLVDGTPCCIHLIEKL